MRIKFVQKIIDTIRNKHSPEYVTADKLKISMSNDCSYPQFCMDARLDDKLFQNFKRNKELLSVIPNNPRVVEEIPLTNPYNYIIIWGENL